MTSSITSGTSAISTSSTTSDTTTTTNTSLGKDTFMKLLLAQLANQDPTKPMDDSAMTAQLAQFSALEQAETTNQTLTLMAQQQVGQSNTATAALVGKNVTINGSTVTLTDSSLSAQCNFSLGTAATSVKVAIVNSDGKTIRTMDEGVRPAGQVNVSWDGKDDGGTQQAAGTYTVVVTAKDANGSSVTVSQQTTGELVSVTFEGGYANLHLDNGATGPAANLIGVNAPPATSTTTTGK
jgi:flagellar basal-body rod modification protein FlgD